MDSAEDEVAFLTANLATAEEEAEVDSEEVSAIVVVAAVGWAEEIEAAVAACFEVAEVSEIVEETAEDFEDAEAEVVILADFEADVVEDHSTISEAVVAEVVFEADSDLKAETSYVLCSNFSLVFSGYLWNFLA